MRQGFPQFRLINDPFMAVPQGLHFFVAGLQCCNICLVHRDIEHRFSTKSGVFFQGFIEHLPHVH